MITRLWSARRSPDRAPAAHATIPAGVRVYAIGDIHGRADLLERTFRLIDEDRAMAQPAQDFEVLLGDYVDRGADSRAVLDMILRRQQLHGRVIPLAGNHEQMFLRILMGGGGEQVWIQNGGAETLRSYGISLRRDPREQDWRRLVQEARAAVPPEHQSFLRHLGTDFSCGHYFFVHAGVRPGVRLVDQTQDDLLWIRQEFLDHDGEFGAIVVHGHTPVSRPDIRDNRINIDTGAYFTGNLTCLVIEPEQIRFI